MENFGLVEADFQQYYGIDLDDYYKTRIAEGTGLLRYLRLFSELPVDSRCIKAISPTESWTLMDETASRILHELQGLSAGYYNVHRKKGAKAIKIPDQLEPKYIKQAKEEYRDAEGEKKKAEIDENTIAFWHSRIKKASK